MVDFFLLYKTDNFCDFLFAFLHTNLKPFLPQETVSVKWHSLFSMENKKYITNFSPAEFINEILLYYVIYYIYLPLNMLSEKFSRRHFGIVVFFSHKIGFDMSFRLSPKETICMKCQSLFSRKNKKKNRQFVVCRISPIVVKANVALFAI